MAKCSALGKVRVMAERAEGAISDCRILSNRFSGFGRKRLIKFSMSLSLQLITTTKALFHVQGRTGEQ
jgi:hypothetical protein